MIAATLDDRRRLVMPNDLSPRSTVTVQKIDDDTWIVKRVRPSQPLVVMLLPDVKKLPRDPEWEATEGRITTHTSKNVAPFEE